MGKHWQKLAQCKQENYFNSLQTKTSKTAWNPAFPTWGLMHERRRRGGIGKEKDVLSSYSMQPPFWTQQTLLHSFLYLESSLIRPNR